MLSVAVGALTYDIYAVVEFNLPLATRLLRSQEGVRKICIISYIAGDIHSTNTLIHGRYLHM